MDIFNVDVKDELRIFDVPVINIVDILRDIIASKEKSNNKDAFYTVDLEDVYNKHINWLTLLPRVNPYYAVKCNTDPMLLKLLAFLGTGFDCASKNEIKMMLDMGVRPERIIFANPCKQASHVEYAFKTGVDYMTFDNVDELYKIKKYHSSTKAKCVLRIATNDEDAVYKLSNKFGVDMTTSFELIKIAVELGLDVVGVCFHVGCSQKSALAFIEPIKNAKILFDYARENHGLEFHVLDIGGGFPGFLYIFCRINCAKISLN
jgi:ornithine decarboxylase